MTLTLQSPLSLYSIPVVWFTAFYPARMKVNLITKTIGYNNVQPRANTRRLLEGGKVPIEVARLAERLEGAHLNGNEILPLWVGAILAGHHAGLSHETMNTVSAAFILVRVLYNYVYMKQANATTSVLRTGLWLTSISLAMFLLVKSANVISGLQIL